MLWNKTFRPRWKFLHLFSKFRSFLSSILQKSEAMIIICFFQNRQIIADLVTYDPRFFALRVQKCLISLLIRAFCVVSRILSISGVISGISLFLRLFRQNMFRFSRLFFHEMTSWLAFFGAFQSNNWLAIFPAKRSCSWGCRFSSQINPVLVIIIIFPWNFLGNRLNYYNLLMPFCRLFWLNFWSICSDNLF